MAAEVNKARAALETAQRDLKSMASLNRVSSHSLAQPLRADDIPERIGPQAIPSSPVGEMARFPPPHCVPLQGRVPVPPFEPWILWQSPFQPPRRNAAVEGAVTCPLSWLINLPDVILRSKLMTRTTLRAQVGTKTLVHSAEGKSRSPPFACFSLCGNP